MSDLHDLLDTGTRRTERSDARAGVPRPHAERVASPNDVLQIQRELGSL